jgi:Ca-activated chloride channel family protein
MIPNFEEIKFANPELLWLLLIIPFLIAWFIWKNKKQFPDINLSTADALKYAKKTLRQRLIYLPQVLRVFTVALIILAIARPQTSSSRKNIKSEGIDIVLTLDISTSMLAEDFKPNRLEAAKNTAIEFIEKRPNDRIGLVIFAGEAYTQTPVTIDHAVVKNVLSQLETGKIKDGTAVGDGLATAVSRLKESKAKSKIIVLLTDGVHNSGFIAPETAAELAKTFGIKTYTIGIGTMGKAPYPVRTPFGLRYQNVDVELDEASMKKIAELTNGKYFRATNNKSLEKIYEEIDKLEKTEIDIAYFNDYTEEFLFFAILAFIFLAIENILKYTYLRINP